MEKKEKQNNVLLYIILALAAVIRLFYINKNIHADDAMGLFFASHPLSEVWKITLYEPHPSGYYYFLHIVSSISTNLIYLRIIAIIIGIISLILIYKITSGLYGNKIANLAVFLLAINPLHITYSLQSRMYMLMSVLLLVAMLLFMHKHYYIGAVFLALSCYMDYFAIPVVAVLLLWLWHRSNFKITLKAGVLTGILCLPLLYFLRISGSAFPTTSQSFLWYFAIIPLALYGFMVGELWYYNLHAFDASLISLWIIFFIMMIAAAYLFLKSKKKPWTVAVMAVCPLLVVYLLRFFTMVQIDAKRHVISGMFFIVLVAYLIIKSKGKAKDLLLAAAIIVSVVSCFYLYDDLDFRDFKGISRHITENSLPNQIVIVGFPNYEAPFEYYYKADDTYIFQRKNDFTDPRWRLDTPEIRDKDIENFHDALEEKENIWYIWAKESTICNHPEPLNTLSQYILMENLSFKNALVLYRYHKAEIRE